MLGRAHLVGPLLASLAVEPAPVLFLCSHGDNDTIRACKKSGEETLVDDFPDHGQYAAKINRGYRETITPWVFCGASDLTFHDGWLRQALTVADRVNAGVVGTQDGANPWVKRGMQSTHSLVRREYVQEFGSATFDGTGEIYSETYDHQWVDVELVETAKLRGRWAFAKRSYVSHSHPHWGTAENDATYEKATRATMADRELHVRRMRRAQQLHARSLRYNRARG
jgi:hypothetical protein